MLTPDDRVKKASGATIRGKLADSAGPLTLYVATDGNDQWSGTLPKPNETKTDGPFASLPRARDEVRKRKPTANHGIEVQVRGGEYLVTETLKLSAADSGGEAAPIVYRAYRSEQPVLVGGKSISAWRRWKGEIQEADLSKQGFEHAAFEMLVFDGRRQHLARWPNFDPQNPYGGGWAYVDGKSIPMYQDVPGESKRAFQIAAGDLRTWQRPNQVEVFVFPRFNWWNNVVRIAAFDRATRQVTLAADCSYPVRPGDRYYFQNALEELDAPGEWYLDRAAGKLYFWPTAPLDGKPVDAPTTDTVIELGNASHITWRGFTIECAAGTAVLVNHARHCMIAACTIRNAGGFERGKFHAVPDDWQWQVRPLPNAVAESAATRPASGRRCLRIGAALNPDKPRDNAPIVVSHELELKLGSTYRLSAKLRATEAGAAAKLMLQSYVANAYFWAGWSHDVKRGFGPRRRVKRLSFTRLRTSRGYE